MLKKDFLRENIKMQKYLILFI